MTLSHKGVPAKNRNPFMFALFEINLLKVCVFSVKIANFES